jgi:hypothetical protein
MRKRGYLDPTLVWRLSFWITTAAIGIAVLASILAIWQFTGRDVLWRTVATCAVVGAGTMTFWWVNRLFAGDDDRA